jgi:DNA polymerase-3 subunit alpha
MLGPDVNASDYRFTPVDRKTIRYGLGAVKGTGEQAVNGRSWPRPRSRRPVQGSLRFLPARRQAHGQPPHIEALIRAGAFDSLDDHRARLLASVGIAMEAAEQAERNAMQVSLFDLLDSRRRGRRAHGPQLRRGAALERAQQAQRGEAGPRLLLFRPPVPRRAGRSVAFSRASRWRRSKRARKAAAARRAGGRRAQQIHGARQDGLHPARRRQHFARSLGVQRVARAERAKIREDEVLIVEGTVQRDDFAGEGRVKVVAERLLTLAEARGRFARHLRLSLNGQASGSNARAACNACAACWHPTPRAIARSGWLPQRRGDLRTGFR